jgi:hypothetical protein
MDDFDIERDLEDAGIDALDFSLMDEDERWKALNDAGLDPDFFLDADLDSSFDAWENLQSAGLSLNDLELMDEDERREALESAGLDWRDYEGVSSWTPAFVAPTPAVPVNKQQEVLPTEPQPVYRYCQVRFSAGGSTYAYRTDNYTIEAGDFVMVPVGNSETPRLVQVVSVGDYAESVVPYPLKRTKFILRKATAADRSAPEISKVPKVLAPKPIPEKAPAENDGDMVAAIREKNRLLTASVILLAILAVMLSVLLYVVYRNNDHTRQTETVRAPSAVYVTATPIPTSTAEPTPSATPRPTARPTSTPRPTATPKRTTSTTKSTKTSDPYNAKSYAYADDFYDDYYDDFWDYEDAEDYWDEWND